MLALNFNFLILIFATCCREPWSTTTGCNRPFSYRNKTVWISLYKTYVRPPLEYCIQAWNPWLVKDKETLERVQKRAIAMTPGLFGSTYEEKLKEVGLISLENRRK